MNFTEATVIIIFLFLPGIIAVSLYNLLKGAKKETRAWFLAIQVFVFAIISYIILYIFNPQLSFFKLIFSNSVTGHELNIWEIIIASGVGVLSSIVSNIFNKYSLITRLANWLKISHAFNETNLVSSCFNMKELKARWLIVRDYQHQLEYIGALSRWLDNDDGHIELLLSDVSVYPFSSESIPKLLYDQDFVYLKMKYGDYSIEFEK